MKYLFTIILSVFLFSTNILLSQENKDEEIFDFLPEQKKVKRHAIGIDVPLYHNNGTSKAINLYYEYLSFEGSAGFQFPIKYLFDELLGFRGVFTGCDFVHHITDHYSKWQFFYGGGLNPGIYIWEPYKDGPYKRQTSFALIFGIKIQLYYMFTDTFGFGTFMENSLILRADGYNQISPEKFKLKDVGSMNLGLKAIYRF